MKVSSNFLKFLLLTLIVTSAATFIIEPSEKLVIDTDGGADDAAAILLALTARANKDSKFEVVAITCVNGNADERTVEQNVLKAITIANASNIRVYGGAKKPILEPISYDYYFGKDGLGDFIFDEPITGKVDQSTYASLALIKLAKLYPRKLNILCTGPLTNIAIASALDPTFIDNVKKFYIMGGSVSGIGNKSPGVEYNFGTDPESYFMVLNHTRDYTKQERSLLYPWETVLNAEVEMTWRVHTLGMVNSKIMAFLNKAEAKSLQDGSQYWTSADIQATAAMIWPHLLRKSIVANVTPVIDGAARGTALVDYTENSGKPKNVEIVQEIDSGEFRRKVLRHFS